MKDIEIQNLIVLLAGLDKKTGGITYSTLSELNLRLPSVGLTKIHDSFNDLIKKKFLRQNIFTTSMIPYYALTPEGERTFLKIKRDEIEFQKLIKFAPAEYEIKYRVQGIEYAIFYAALSFVTFKITLLLIQSGHVVPSLIALILDFLFIGLMASYIGQVCSYPITQLFMWCFGGTYNLLDKRLRLSGTIITILIIAAAFFAWYKLDSNFQANMWTVIFSAVVSGITGIVFIRDWVVSILIKTRNKIKEDLDLEET